MRLCVLGHHTCRAKPGGAVHKAIRALARMYGGVYGVDGHPTPVVGAFPRAVWALPFVGRADVGGRLFVAPSFVVGALHGSVGALLQVLVHVHTLDPLPTVVKGAVVQAMGAVGDVVRQHPLRPAFLAPLHGARQGAMHADPDVGVQLRGFEGERASVVRASARSMAAFILHVLLLLQPRHLHPTSAVRTLRRERTKGKKWG